MQQAPVYCKMINEMTMTMTMRYSKSWYKEDDNIIRMEKDIAHAQRAVESLQNLGCPTTEEKWILKGYKDVLKTYCRQNRIWHPEYNNEERRKW